MTELRAAALQALLLTDPQAKCDAVGALGSVSAIDPERCLAAPSDAVLPGRPARPRVVAAGQVARRGLGTPGGRAALLHALAHIEFGAINLALDVVWRFAGLPIQFYRDWATVAAEEALHFSMLQARLRAYGCTYGDFDVHDSLWEMAFKTRDDPLARMALVPRWMEARGLDATPPMRAKLLQAADEKSAACLATIERDEIGHVAIGNRWFHYLCEVRQLTAAEVDRDLRRRYGAPRLRPPFNVEARRLAGFSDAEIAALGNPS